MARFIDGHAFLYHNATPRKPGWAQALRTRTSLEQIAAESLTQWLFQFVHRDMWFAFVSETQHRV